METNLIEYILKRYQGKPCVFNNEIILYFEEFEDDDSFHNAFNLTKLFSDYLILGDKVTIDDDSYFFDVNFNSSDVDFIQNDYHIVNKMLLEAVSRQV